MELLSFDALTMHLIEIRTALQSRIRGYVNISIIQQLAVVKVIYAPLHHKVLTNDIHIFQREKMAADMDPEEMEEWRTIFNLFDVDGDESITCEVKILVKLLAR